MSESGEAGWIPVASQRSRRGQPGDPSFMDSTCSGDQANELQTTIKSACDVTFQYRDGVPGLGVQL